MGKRYEQRVHRNVNTSFRYMKKYLTSLIVKKLAEINFIKYHVSLSTAKIPEVEPHVLWEKLWTNKHGCGVDGSDTK